ncbi:MAG TPA: F0F1 ATP synthase subunit B [Pelagibacteraceae bacterium]|nr:F0F1 ATP synthase subunit B [Pelagibacteraceae bacterium]
MPQLNPEFWASQIFWLILIFSSLYIIIWKIFLPKITNSIENRKSRIIGDLNETQKLKENAEKKLGEYNKIIEDTKKEAKSIIESSKKKLENDINSKKQKFNEEIEKELMTIEKEIKSLKKTSISNINRIAVEISSEIVNQIVETKVNASNVSAIVEDISKRKVEKYL